MRYGYFLQHYHRRIEAHRSDAGKRKQVSENFAILRSIIDAAIKNSLNVLHALSVIADYKTN